MHIKIYTSFLTLYLKMKSWTRAHFAVHFKRCLLRLPLTLTVITVILTVITVIHGRYWSCSRVSVLLDSHYSSNELPSGVYGECCRLQTWRNILINIVFLTSINAQCTDDRLMNRKIFQINYIFEFEYSLKAWPRQL